MKFVHLQRLAVLLFHLGKCETRPGRRRQATEAELAADEVEECAHALLAVNDLSYRSSYWIVKEADVNRWHRESAQQCIYEVTPGSRLPDSAALKFWTKDEIALFMPSQEVKRHVVSRRWLYSHTVTLQLTRRVWGGFSRVSPWPVAVLACREGCAKGSGEPERTAETIVARRERFEQHRGVDVPPDRGLPISHGGVIALTSTFVLGGAWGGCPIG